MTVQDLADRTVQCLSSGLEIHLRYKHISSGSHGDRVPVSEISVMVPDPSYLTDVYRKTLKAEPPNGWKPRYGNQILIGTVPFNREKDSEIIAQLERSGLFDPDTIAAVRTHCINPTPSSPRRDSQKYGSAVSPP